MTVSLNKRIINQTPIITAQQLRDWYLFGVNLQDDNGNAIDDATLEHYITAAMRWLEAEIPGLLLSPTTITAETHDYYYDDYLHFGFVQLKYFPVTDVSRYAIQFPLQTQVLAFDPTWINVNYESGQVNLIPSQGSLSAVIIGAGGSFLPLLYGSLEFVPDLIKIDYTAGFDAADDPGNITVPENIMDLVGMKAALGPLNLVGDLVAGAGVASKSLGIDGISQGISTTASAENMAYSAKMKDWQGKIKDELPRLRRYYQGIQFVTA